MARFRWNIARKWAISRAAAREGRTGHILRSYVGHAAGAEVRGLERHSGQHGFGFPSALALLACVLLITSPASGRVEVNVTRVGFPTLCHGHVIRDGHWTPVIVDLDLVGAASFSGSVQVAQTDIDGDQCIDGLEVHLHPDTGGNARRFLYVPASPLIYDERFGVELLGAEGEAIEVVSQGELTFRPVPSQQPVTVPDDDYLILSVSSGAVGRVSELVVPNHPIAFEPPVHVGHVSPSELPDLWIGLEAVDAVVWDEARPEELTERQRQALIQWVQFGGTLLLTGARSAHSIRQSEGLNEILPLDLGVIVSTDRLPETRRLLAGPASEGTSDVVLPPERADDAGEWFEEPFERQVLVARCKARSGAAVLAKDELPVSGEQDAELSEAPIVAEWRWGRGRVIYSAVALSDLLTGSVSAPEFFTKLFYLARVREENSASPQPLTLYRSVVSAVAFSTSSSFYLLAAFLFSGAYLLGATAGTWWFLGRRGWRRHSWSAFAVVALAATFLSVIAVGWIRGLGDRVHQLSVIDVRAGERFGVGTTFFGLKTAADKELDLWLPADPISADEPKATANMLKPLPPGSGSSESRLGFADPAAYRVVPSTAVIGDVRVRSTLKRFEGRWQGPLEGSVHGQINIIDSLLTEESFVLNELNGDLYNCYLLHAQLDPFDAGRGRLAPTPRSAAIYAYPLGRIAAGVRVALAPLCNPQPDPMRGGARGPSPTLRDRHKLWSEPLRRTLDLRFGASGDEGIALGQEQNALLLASTVSQFDPATFAGMVHQFFGPAVWSRDRLRQLDLSDELTRDTAILVGFADGPGPVRLFGRSGGRRYHVIKPEAGKSSVMYRVRIPVSMGRGGES
jgi:hypothetical protein